MSSVSLIDGHIDKITNYDRIRDMSVEEIATAIYQGISSDPCDYCEYNNGYCTGKPCSKKSNVEVIKEWLESEAETE